jgi:hypothetical protein
MLRVFISHSAAGDDDTEAMELLVALDAALKDDDFAVKYDRKDLQLGVNWRSMINFWINHCDAAVVLLSQKALRSSYVSYEITSLVTRKKTIIPVFLTGVGYNEVDDSPLSPSRLHDIHSLVNETDQQRRVARVKEQLLSVKRGMASVNRQAELLADCLRPVSLNEVRRQLDKLEPGRDAWMEDADPYLSLAIKMMSVGIDRATKVILDLLDVLKNNDKMYEAFALTATSWVDARAVEDVKAVAAGARDKRAVATNATEKLIADIYVWCASERPPGNSWTVVEGSGIFSEEAFDEMKGEITEVLRERFNISPEDDLEEELVALEETEQPVFVTLSAAGISQSMFAQLRGAFPTVTFFLRVGGAGDRDPVGGVVKLIQPPLESDFEKNFCELYIKKRKVINLLARSVSRPGGGTP